MPLKDRELLKDVFEFSAEQEDQQPINPDLTGSGQSIVPDALKISEARLLSFTGQQRQQSDDEYWNSFFSKTDKGAGRKQILPGDVSYLNTSDLIEPAKRYPFFYAFGRDNEEIYGQSQGWLDKAGNGILKGLSLMGTTFLQSTVGLVYGVGKSLSDWKLSSFYNNEFTNGLDRFNKSLEDKLPNYYTRAERDAEWWEPDNLLTANFLWDKIVKNLGFAAGAVASGFAYAKLINAIPQLSKLMSGGKTVEALAATEEGILSTLPPVERANQVISNLTKLSNQITGSYNNLNTAQRAVVSGLATIGEASFEALNNLNQFRAEQIQKFKDDHGFEPTGQDLDRINKMAENVGDMSMGLNVALLSMSNYIQFPKILGSSVRAEKAIANDIVRKTKNIVQDASGNFIEAQRTKFGKILDRRKYFFSVTEAAEEGSQFIVQAGVQNYYDKKNRGEDSDFLTDVVGEGAWQMLHTKEGMENILLGGFSGAIMMAKGKIQENRRDRINTAAAISSFNSYSFSNYIKDGVDAANRAITLQQQREAAIRQGDILEAKDLEADYSHNYLSSRIKYGRYDLVKQDINQMRELASTPGGFLQLQQEGKASAMDTQATFLSRLINFEKHADNVKSFYESLNIRYSGILNENGGRKYSDDVVDKMVYAAGKIADYDTRIPQLSVSLIAAGIDIPIITDEDHSPNDVKESLRQINALPDITRDTRDDLKRALQDGLELQLRRKLFIGEYDSIKEDPTKYEEKIIVSEDGSPLKVKDKEFEIGKEYPLSDIVTRKGNVISVAPTVQVLNKTLGGEVEVKLPDGRTTFVDPNTLLNFELADNVQFSDRIKTDANEIVNQIITKHKLSIDSNLSLNDKLSQITDKEIADELFSLLSAKIIEYKKLAGQTKLFDELFKKDPVQTGENTEDFNKTIEDNPTVPVKPLSILFTTSGSPTEEINKRDFHKRFEIFADNWDSLTNEERAETFVIPITQANQDSFGLPGFIEGIAENKVEVNNIDNGIVALVVVKKTPDEYKFVDKNNKITEDTNNLTFSLLISTGLTYTSAAYKGTKKYYTKGDTNTPEQFQSAARIFRKSLLENTQPTPISFGVSRGFPIEDQPIITETGEKIFPQNAVTQTIASLRDIDNTPDIIQVSTGDPVVTETTSINFPKGRPFFKRDNTVVYLHNRSFSKDEATTLFQVIKEMAKQFGESQNIDNRLIRFLKSIVYFTTDTSVAPYRNQIKLDNTTGELILGRNKERVLFTEESIEANKEKIQVFLADVFNNISNIKLKEDKNVPYEQITGIVEDGTIQSKLWKTYRHFLVSHQYIDNEGKVSARDDKPHLFTSIKKRSEVVDDDIVFRNRYMILNTDIISNVPVTPVVIEKKVETKKEEKEISTESLPTDTGKIIFERKGDDINPLYLEAPDGTQKPFKNKQKTIDYIKSQIKEKEGTIVVEPSPKPVVKPKPNPNNDDFRRVNKFDVERITEQEWNEFKVWMGENLPLVKFERVKHLINTTDGGFAWGRLSGDLITVAESAEIGTGYHEAFEAVWKYFVPKDEQARILREFRSKVGTFQDRVSGKKVSFMRATDQQIKEQIADDFADFMKEKSRIKRLPLLQRMFESLKSFIDWVFTGNNADRLFNRINKGYYKKRTPYPSINTPDYRRIGTYTEEEVNGINQAITVFAFREAIKDNKSFFEPQGISSPELYGKVRELINTYEYEGFKAPSDEQWNEFIKYNRIFLRSFGIAFDESSDTLTYQKDETSNRDYAVDQFTTNVNNSNTAMKLLFGTIAATEFREVKPEEVGNKLTPIRARDGVHGLPYLANKSKLFVQILQTMTSKTEFSQMMKELSTLANEDAELNLLYKRLKGNPTTGEIDFQRLTMDDWRLLISFYVSFSRQAPTPYIQYIKDGDVYTQSADIGGIQTEQQEIWVENMKVKATLPDALVKLNPDGKYTVNAKKKNTHVFKGPITYLPFLNDLGINFSKEDFSKLTTSEQVRLAQYAANIFTNLKVNTKELSIRTLDVKQSLKLIAQLYIKATKPQSSSVIYGVKNEQRQRYIQHNYVSVFANEFNNALSLEELLINRPELNNTFSRSSLLLKKGGEFFDEDGKRTSKKLKVSYIAGIINQDNDKSTTTELLNYSDRIVLEINQNINGNYYIIVPADSSTEWMLNIPNFYSTVEFDNGGAYSKIYSNFKGYLQDEYETSQETDENSPSQVRKHKGQLRFFRDILSDQKLIQTIENEIEKGTLFEEVYSELKDRINSNIRQYVEDQANERKQLLLDYRKLEQSGDTYSFPGLDSKIKGKDNLSESEINNILKTLSINYITSEIEFHKILFGDPAQYKDELKRIKSSESPRASTFIDPNFTSFARENLNKGLESQNIGYTNFSDTIDTVVLSDFDVVSSFIDNEGFKEVFPVLHKEYTKDKIDSSDASAWGSPVFFREFKTRNGDWSPKAEPWWQYEMALTRDAYKNELSEEEYPEKLRKADKQTLKKEVPTEPQEVLKPILSGVDSNGNNILDKYSIFPMYYSAVKGTDGEKLLLRMLKENISYAIVPTARKVGVYNSHDFYENGAINEAEFNNKTNISWKYIGKQVETTFETDKRQPRGSQLTKLATIDLLEAGVPIDIKDYSPMQWLTLAGSEKEKLSPLYKEVKYNEFILNKMTKNGYNSLLEELGIQDNGELYTIEDKSKVQTFLQDQILSRDPDINLINSFELNEDGEFIISFEANSQYQQIKNILLSAVDKRIVRPRVNGTSFTQASSALFNKVKDLKWFIKEGGEYKEVDINKVEEKDRKKLVPSSSALNFYEPVFKDGKVESVGKMEVFIPKPKSFNNKFKGKSDEEIINFLNTSKEGRDILSGIGFRIPTQSLGSVEAFIIKGFTHPSLGNTIIVPADLVKKAGSDFDIDKLNTYLKNVYSDREGNVKLVEYFESREDHDKFYGDLFEDILEIRKDKLTDIYQSKEELFGLIDTVFSGTTSEKVIKKILEQHENRLNNYLNQFNDTEEALQELKIVLENMQSQAEELNNDQLQDLLKKLYIQKTYTQSLENEYFTSLENIITHPLNFERLLTPISNGQLEKLRNDLVSISEEEFGSVSKSLLSWSYLSKTRHDYISGKRGIGIGATSQTNHSLAQRVPTYIDTDKIKRLSKEDQDILGDGSILLPHNTIEIDGKNYTAVSLREDVYNRLISDKISAYTNGYVDIAKDPFIIEIGADRKLGGTFLFLERIGVPTEIVVYFMNQPIIRDIRREMDIRNISSPMFVGKETLDNIRAKYPSKETAKTIDEKKLKDNIKNHYTPGKKLNEQDNAEQKLILSEFFKYVKMAEHMFNFNQSTNYDTANFNDFIKLYQKELKTETEEEVNIISSVRDLLSSSFVGKVAETLNDTVDALSTVLKFETPTTRNFLDEVRYHFIQKGVFLSQEDLVKVSNKITASLIDYVTQTELIIRVDDKDVSLNSQIQELFINGGAVKALEILRKEVPGNPFIAQLSTLVKTSEDTQGKYLVFKQKDNESPTKNLYIASVQELVEHPNPVIQDAIKTVIKAGLLQSGVYKSSTSLTQTIPIELYAGIINPVINNLFNISDINLFNDTNAFFRNNWNNDDIVPVLSRMVQLEDFRSGQSYWAHPNYAFRKNGIARLFGTKVIEVSTQFDRQATKKPVVIVRMLKNEYRNKKAREIALREGKNLYIKRLYQIVIGINGKPLNGKPSKDGFPSYVYKQINAWGDGQHLQEYYKEPRQSQINNLVEKTVELSDDEVRQGYQTKKNLPSVIEKGLEDGTIKKIDC